MQIRALERKVSTLPRLVGARITWHFILSRKQLQFVHVRKLHL